METESRFEDIFTQMTELQADFPEAAQSTPWYGEKLDEEVGEFKQIAQDEPDLKSFREQAGELTDILITLVGAYLNLGIDAQTAIMLAQAKAIAVRERFASGHYKENPQLKPRTVYESKPIAMSEGVDYMADYE